MQRRDFLLASAAFLPFPVTLAQAQGNVLSATAGTPAPNVPWAKLAEVLGDRLAPVEWPLAKCLEQPDGEACRAFFGSVSNPYFLGDNPALTQTFGWVGAWSAQPSAYVVKAQSAQDVAAAVNFARSNGVRLAVKGGGHSYQGCSNSAHSLLIWTRAMQAITTHDAFIPEGSKAKPVEAVTIGAGAIWGDVYREVCVRAGRYVQGGGCLTVGVAGLVQSGGFGSFSKRYGLAASSLLQAEIVTADGLVRIVNENQEPELFFALKGGGGGTFGVITSLTLKTHVLPKTFGAVFAEIRANSDDAYSGLIERAVSFYSQSLFNPNWGEQLAFRPNNALAISMVFQDLEQAEAERVWAPFFGWVKENSDKYQLASDPVVLAVPATSFFDAEFLKTLPGVVETDSQPGASKERIFWASNREEAGQVIHAYQSTWLSEDLLGAGSKADLSRALFEASRHWSVSLHTNKALAGAPENVREAARNTAMNPAVADAFALLICAAEGPPAYPGVHGHEPDLEQANRDAARVDAAMNALRSRIATNGSYLAESNYFQTDWQKAFWGENIERLQKAKRKYDPENIFSVHHNVGEVD
ncbi:FAD/FMN-dependent dehydrogenase [Phyllobacterium sp. YR531]|nr:FAD/FMN-dependent dehydrogenase [Phyllobacterium sp. YR531]